MEGVKLSGERAEVALQAAKEAKKRATNNIQRMERAGDPEVPEYLKGIYEYQKKSRQKYEDLENDIRKQLGGSNDKDQED